MAEDQQGTPLESPLPPVILRGLGDRAYDKRKAAALDVTSLIKSLQEHGDQERISHVINLLAQDFARSRNVHHRKGGLIGLAATAIGLTTDIDKYLQLLIPPVIECFDDPESRVCYYACESLYNISKVARTSVLKYFNQIFEGLCKLFAHVDVGVKNGANLLDRLIKDIVTEAETFDIETFIPLLQKHIKRTKPYIRQLLVSWITVLDAVPDINMLDYLPDFLDGLFNMLSDSNREIKKAADNALLEFLKEIKEAEVVEFGPMVTILVSQTLLKTISDPADEVVLMNLQVLARISLDEVQFQLVLNSLIQLFLEDRNLLETRGALESDHGSHYCLRGLCLAKLKKYDMALEDLDLSCQLDPSAFHYYSRGTVLADSLKFDSAIKGRAHKLLCEYKRADECISNSILLDPTQPAFFAERGDVRYRTGRPNQIIESIYEIEENLADVLNKRAQAKLLLDTNKQLIEEALVDSRRALVIVPNDINYSLVVSTCYIRLKQFDQAIEIIQQVLEKSPNNEKALFQYSFCLREVGSRKNAIEELTKIIAYSDKGLISPLVIPIHRVYETRGTLLHEIQAHKLALADIGKAVSLNPERPENLYLRADCHAKLGNYEQAINDYNYAETKSFPDLYTLYTSRGMVHRLRGRSDEAIIDFDKALVLLDSKDKIDNEPDFIEQYPVLLPIPGQF
eukprot:gene17430-22982_t